MSLEINHHASKIIHSFFIITHLKLRAKKKKKNAIEKSIIHSQSPFTTHAAETQVTILSSSQSLSIWRTRWQKNQEGEEGTKIRERRMQYLFALRLQFGWFFLLHFLFRHFNSERTKRWINVEVEWWIQSDVVELFSFGLFFFCECEDAEMDWRRKRWRAMYVKREEYSAALPSFTWASMLGLVCASSSPNCLGLKPKRVFSGNPAMQHLLCSQFGLHLGPDASYLHPESTSCTLGLFSCFIYLIKVNRNY